MNSIGLLAMALLAVVTSLVALTRRSLIHGGLMLVVGWMAIAGFYFVTGAEFVALAQMLVYVGAVSMVVLFAVVLTRPAEEQLATPTGESAWRALSGIACAAPLLGMILACAGTIAASQPVRVPFVSVREIGLALMERHAPALLLVGVILTAALIGAVLLAAPEEKEDAK
ncbi:MAG: NADH-quinone oxidoreductase subunit J [Opitutaceae bacterium]|nr:NADH-quinone oxidoreductase subunit J [Opitutaceae bacterium]